MRITWIEDGSLEDGSGHGVDFYLGHPRDGQFVAAVLGFEWLHGRPRTVEIRFRPVLTNLDATREREVRAAIESYVRSRKPVEGLLSTDLYAHING